MPYKYPHQKAAQMRRQRAKIKREEEALQQFAKDAKAATSIPLAFQQSIYLSNPLATKQDHEIVDRVLTEEEIASEAEERRAQANSMRELQQRKAAIFDQLPDTVYAEMDRKMEKFQELVEQGDAMKIKSFEEDWNAGHYQ